MVFLVLWSLGRSWRPLEASWSRLGDVLEQSWSDLKLLLNALGASKWSEIDLRLLRIALGAT